MGAEALAYAAFAAAVGSGVHGNQKAQQFNQRADARQKELEAKMASDLAKGEADKAKSIEESESARRRKQVEELGRRGRRASILTSASGTQEQLGSIGRPEARASELLGG